MPECIECGNPATIDHHVVPQSLGGQATVPMCDECHGLVHGQAATDLSTLIKEGMRRAKEAGYAYGAAPYGFQVSKDGRVVTHKQEQAALRRIHQLMDEGLGSSAITRRLQKEGYAPRGERWHRSTVSKIIDRRRRGES